MSVWYSKDERTRLEHAAAVAGYKHVSAYIRDKSLARDPALQTILDGVGDWRVERHELTQRLDAFGATHSELMTMLAMLLARSRKRATAGQVSELVGAMAKARSPMELVAATAPELAAGIEQR